MFDRTPEFPINEVWQWFTNVIVSDDGTEQRIDLSALPKRSFRLQYIWDDQSKLRSDMRTFLKFGSAFDVPLYQYQTAIAPAPAPALGATVLAINAARTDLRAGGLAWVWDEIGGETVTVTAVTSASVTIAAPGLSRAYSARALITPARSLYSTGNAVLSRLNSNLGGQANWTLREVTFNDPFLNPFNTAALPTLAGLPVLESRPIGGQFDQGVDTGATVDDYGGALNIRNRWTHAKEVFARTFLCNRIANPADWDLWRQFADYAKGSCNPFYVPTYRTDFDVALAPALGGTTLKLSGQSYLTDYFPYGTYKAIAIYSNAGVKYATVTNAVASGSDTLITFSPALPGAGAWNVNSSVSLLLLCRIADDKVSCDHFALHSEISLNLRTVDA